MKKRSGALKKRTICIFLNMEEVKTEAEAKAGVTSLQLLSFRCAWVTVERKRWPSISPAHLKDGCNSCQQWFQL